MAGTSDRVIHSRTWSAIFSGNRVAGVPSDRHDLKDDPDSRAWIRRSPNRTRSSTSCLPWRCWLSPSQDCSWPSSSEDHQSDFKTKKKGGKTPPCFSHQAFWFFFCVLRSLSAASLPLDAAFLSQSMATFLSASTPTPSR